MQPDNQIDMSALLAQAQQQVQQKLIQAQRNCRAGIATAGEGQRRLSFQVTMHGSSSVTAVHRPPRSSTHVGSRDPAGT